MEWFKYGQKWDLYVKKHSVVPMCSCSLVKNGFKVVSQVCLDPIYSHFYNIFVTHRIKIMAISMKSLTNCLIHIDYY